MNILHLISSLSLTFIVLSPVHAQQKTEHEKIVYVNENNEIFWNKNLPVYINLSTSPNKDAETYRMESKIHPQYTNPYYFDTEGVNYIRTRWAVDPKTGQTVYPQEEVMWQLYADGVAPVSTLGIEGKVYKKEGKTFIGKEGKIAFSTVDEVSGVNNIYYSVNQGEYIAYTSPLQLDKEQTYSLKFYAVDKVGNAEEIKEAIYEADLSAPNTTLTLGGGHYENVLSGKGFISLEAIDNLSGVQKITYRLDEHKAEVYKENIYIGWLPEGEHSLTYQATDNVANTEIERKYTFYVDKSPPILTREILGNSYLVNGKEYSSGKSRLQLLAIDNKAGVEVIYYSINDTEFVLYDQPVILNEKGKLTVKSYAVDKVGNKTALDGDQKGLEISTYHMDLTGPDLRHEFLGKIYEMHDTIYISKDTQIRLLATDSESGVKMITYSLDGAEDTDYSAPITISGEGLHELTFYGYDNVINRNMETFVFFVDNEGPDVFARFSLPKKGQKQLENKVLDTYESQTAVFLSATDQKVGYEEMYYSINGTPEQAYKGVIKNLTKGQPYTIKVKALDKLGNTKESDIEFFLDQ